MEFVVPMAQIQSSPDFNFSCGSTAINSPYATAPSSPRPFGHPDDYFYCYASAPSSPARAAAAYSSFAANNIDEPRKGMSPSPEFIKEFEFGLSIRGQEELSKGQAKPSKPRQQPLPPKPHKAPISSPSSPAAAKGGGSSRKWRLKDLLLFRSASEGRATGSGSKDPLRKYTLLSSSFNKRRHGGDQIQESASKGIASARSLDSSGNSSMKRGPVSAHELHYTANRAAAEEQKKRTPLPFHRNSLFGCLHFNPAVRSISRGLNSYSFNQGRP